MFRYPTTPFKKAPSATDNVHAENSSSEENCPLIVDYPMVTPQKTSTVPSLVEATPDYEDSPDAETPRNELDSSLHTTSSDISIDLNHLFSETADDVVAPQNEDGDDLSVHVSQLDSSDLKEGITSSEEKESNGDSAGEEIGELACSHFADAFVNVGQQILETDGSTAKAETETEASQFSWISLALVFGCVAQNLYQWVSTNLQPEEIQTNPAFSFQEDENKIMIGNDIYLKVDLEASSGGTGKMFVQYVLLLGFAATFAFQSKKKPEKSILDEATSKAEDKIDDTDSTHGSDASSIKASDEGIPMDELSVPSMVPVKLEIDESTISGFDLSNFDSLKVKELRDLLRKRNCDSSGRKSDLIQRLASVYYADIQSLPRDTIRKMLKERRLKQSGSKNVLIQRLVESGP